MGSTVGLTCIAGLPECPHPEAAPGECAASRRPMRVSLVGGESRQGGRLSAGRMYRATRGDQVIAMNPRTFAADGGGAGSAGAGE